MTHAPAVQRVNGTAVVIGGGYGPGNTFRDVPATAIQGRTYATRVRAFLRSPGWQCTYSTGRG